MRGSHSRHHSRIDSILEIASPALYSLNQHDDAPPKRMALSTGRMVLRRDSDGQPASRYRSGDEPPPWPCPPPPVSRGYASPNYWRLRDVPRWASFPGLREALSTRRGQGFNSDVDVNAVLSLIDRGCCSSGWLPHDWLQGVCAGDWQ